MVFSPLIDFNHQAMHDSESRQLLFADRLVMPGDLFFIICFSGGPGLAPAGGNWLGRPGDIDQAQKEAEERQREKTETWTETRMRRG